MLSMTFCLTFIGLHPLDEPDHPDPASLRSTLLPESPDLPENQDLRAVVDPDEGLLHDHLKSLEPKNGFFWKGEMDFRDNLNAGSRVAFMPENVYFGLRLTMHYLLSA